MSSGIEAVRRHRPGVQGVIRLYFPDFHRIPVRRKPGGRFVACFVYPWEDLEIRFDRVRSGRLCFGTMSAFVNGKWDVPYFVLRSWALMYKTLQIYNLQGFASVRVTWRREGDSNP